MQSNLSRGSGSRYGVKGMGGILEEQWRQAYLSKKDPFESPPRPSVFSVSYVFRTVVAALSCKVFLQ